MSDTDLSSMGFTSFGKTPKHHQTAPIHANPTPLPTSLPPRPPGLQQQQDQTQSQGYHDQQRGQGQFHRGGGRGRGGGGGGGGNYRGNFDNRRGRGGGGPHRRGFPTNSQHQRGGRGGRHHHPYPHRQSQPHDHHHGQERDSSTSSMANTPSYRSEMFGEGLYKPSMNEDPWAALIRNRQGQGGDATVVVGDVWMGQGQKEEEDRSKWYDKAEDKATDGGGWNADEIDLGDD